jgi:hypothetical protein
MTTPKIPQFISNTTLNQDQFQFARNFSDNQLGEANTYLNIWAESIYKIGTEVYYIERTVGEAEPIFGEYLSSKLENATRMFLQAQNLNNNGGWQTPDIYSKFGLTISDEETFLCPKITFSQAKLNPNYVGDDNEPQFLEFYPKQGDLIYVVNAKKLFCIEHIEDEKDLGYIFGNRNAYEIKCKVYTYDHSEVSTDSSMPPEIQALDINKIIQGTTYDVTTQEKTTYNDTITNEATTVVDTSEKDPLFK